MKLDETYFSGQELSDDEDIVSASSAKSGESPLDGTVVIYFKTDVKDIDVEKCFSSYVAYAEQMKSVSRLIMPVGPDELGEFNVGIMLQKIDVCDILMLYRKLFETAKRCGLKPKPGGVYTSYGSNIVTTIMHNYIMRPYRTQFNDVRKEIQQIMNRDDVWMYEYILMMFNKCFGVDAQVLHNQLERYFNVLTPQMYLITGGWMNKHKKFPKVLTSPEIMRILNEVKPDRAHLVNMPKYCGRPDGTVYGVFDRQDGSVTERRGNAGLSEWMIQEFEEQKPRWWMYYTDTEKRVVRLFADYGSFIKNDIAYTLVLFLEFYPTDEKCPENLNEFIGIDAKSTDMQTLISYFRRALMGLE